MNKNIFSLLIVFYLLSLGAFAQKKIVLLHTNDTHSRIDPMPENDKYNANIGGVVRREAFLNNVRSENKNVLVFDSGDFLQGTPYFNLFKGKVEIEALNMMKYDAVTLGNHEFDYGLEVLKDVVKQSKVAVITTNYDFTDTPLAGMTKKYQVFVKDGLRIGVIGIGVQPKGLIASENYKGMKYLSPVETANETATYLKKKKRCDVVICLSHLGYEDDLEFAAKSINIDIILGGHSHTFMEKNEIKKNAIGHDVTIFQNGDKGLYVGRLDVELKAVK